MFHFTPVMLAQFFSLCILLFMQPSITLLAHLFPYCRSQHSLGQTSWKLSTFSPLCYVYRCVRFAIHTHSLHTLYFQRFYLLRDLIWRQSEQANISCINRITSQPHFFKHSETWGTASQCKWWMHSLVTTYTDLGFVCQKSICITLDTTRHRR